MLSWLLRSIAWLAVIALSGLRLIAVALMDPLDVGPGLACLITAALVYAGFLHRPRGASVVVAHGGHSSHAGLRQVKWEVRVVAVRQPLGGLEVEEAVLRRLRPKGGVPVVFVESGRPFARAVAGVSCPTTLTSIRPLRC